MRWALTSVMLLSLATLAPAQANVHINPGERSNRNAEFRQAVANYCRLDYDGARLTPQGWTRIQPITSWRDNPDFKRVAIVTRYEILPDPRPEHGRYGFDVQYDISGEYDLAGGYFPDPTRVVVHIEVGEDNGDFKVVQTSEPSPFTGRTRFVQWLQAKLATETDPVAKATIQASLQRFQDQAKKPEATQ